MKRMTDFGAKIPPEIDSDLLEDYSKIPEDVSIYEISGPLFFASAKEYAEVIKNVGMNSKVLIIRMRHVPFIDSTGFHNLEQVIEILQESGVYIILAGVNKSVLNDFYKHKINLLIKKISIFDSFDKAIQYSQKLVENK
ncbi:MAG: sodium-independent anion transporter [Melioribacteraceae bacterium]|nr:sodium-independent anion transporter [Melioribacteraceae bacterium]